MAKKYIVRLSEAERAECRRVIDTLAGKSQKVRRAQILLQTDADGNARWPDTRIAQAYRCREQTVANLRKRLVEHGFMAALNGLQPCRPSRQPLLDEKQQAQLLATRLGSPPKGYANWSLRLLAEQAVELGIVESISHETCRQVLKKMA